MRERKTRQKKYRIIIIRHLFLCVFLTCFSSLYANLPPWFDTLYQLELNGRFGIGVSGPGLDRDDARRQAKLRGAAVMALCKGHSLEKVLEHYKEKKPEIGSAGKANIMVKLSTRFDTAGVIICDEYYNRYGECFLLVKKERDDTSKRCGLTCFMYMSEYDVRNDVDLGRLEIEISVGGKLTDRYVKRSYKRRQYFEACFDGKDVNFPGSAYSYICYSGISGKLKHPAVNSAGLLKYSFWSGFIPALCKAIAGRFNSEANIGASSELTNLKARNFIRAISDELYSVSIRIIGVEDNKIGLNTVVNYIP